jgi:nucleotide-binding universal stress UspA family protein
MLPFRRILFPVDYSQPCDALVPYVKEAASRFQAALTVVHAYGTDGRAYGQYVLPDPDWSARVYAFEHNRLKNFAASAFPAQHVEIRVKQEEPGTYIREIVEHEAIDLIMLSTRGQGPLRKLLLGSVTAKVLHDVSAAVWTCASAVMQDRQAATPYRSILCALDGTDEAEAVLRTAAYLASSYHADLSLLHAVATPPICFEADFAPYRKDLMDTADFRLRELKSKLHIDAPHKVTETSLIDGVRDEVRQRNVDLLVVGRGQSQKALAGLWSNLYPLIRESPCPVLSI